MFSQRGGRPRNITIEFAFSSIIQRGFDYATAAAMRTVMTTATEVINNESCAISMDQSGGSKLMVL